MPGATDGVVEHSRLRWPEGGIVMVSSAGRGDDFGEHNPPGTKSVSVVTDRPDELFARDGRRCAGGPAAARRGLRLARLPVADPDGNLWSFGTYRGEPS